MAAESASAAQLQVAAEPVFARAPMPAARWCRLQAEALHAVDGGAGYALDADAVQQVARLAAGATLVVADRQGRALRIRGARDTTLCAVEPVDNGQRCILAMLRTAVAGELGRTIVHELQNPLNAASLRAELLRTLVERGGPQAGADVLLRHLDGLRERLNHLAGMQATLAERWLAVPREDETASQTLPELLSDCAELMRAYYARRGAGLAVTMTALHEAPLPAAAAAALRTAVCALLLMAAPAAGAQEPQAAALRVAGEDDAVIVECPLPDGAGALASAVGWSAEELLAAIAFMLQPWSIALLCAQTVRLRVGLTRR